jgi:hypothetical protein
MMMITMAMAVTTIEMPRMMTTTIEVLPLVVVLPTYQWQQQQLMMNIKKRQL